MSDRNPMLPVPSSPGYGLSGNVVDAEPPSVGSYFRAVRRHPFLVLGAAAIGFGLSGFLATRAEPMYTSSALIQLAQERAVAPSGGLAGLAASFGAGAGSIQSQIEVMRSRRLLGQVVDSLGLRLQRPVSTALRTQHRPSGVVDQVMIEPDATLRQLQLTFGEGSLRVDADGRAVEAAYGAPISVGGVHFVVPRRPAEETLTLLLVSRDAAIGALHQDVSVYHRDGTDVLDVVANGYDPVVTERVANRVAEQYRLFTTAKAREQAEKQRVFLQNQLTATEALLRETQNELTAFRQREGLYSSKAQAAGEQAGGMELELERAALDAQRSIYRSLLADVQRGGPRLSDEALQRLVAAPGVAENPLIADQYSQMSRYRATRDSLLSGPYGKSPNDPDIQRLDQQMATSQSRLLSAARTHVETLDAQVAAYDMIQGRIAGALRDLAGSEPEEVRLALRMEAIGEAVSELRSRYYTAGMAEAGTVDQVTILDSALPGYQAGPGPFRSVLLGLIFGLMVGGAAAIALDTANRTFRRRGEMERHLRVPSLAVIPPIAGVSSRRTPLRLPLRSGGGNGAGRNGLGGELVSATRVHSLGAEAYRTLRTNLQFSQAVENLRSVVVTSPSGGEGKTTTASNLAVTFAQQGSRVLLVDCDVRRPRVHSVFQVAKEPGLSDVLMGAIAVEQAIQPSRVAGLSIMSAGTLPSVSATDLLSGPVLRSLMNSLSADYELVILDAPPVLVAANAAVLGTAVDGVLLVVRAGRTEPATAQEAIQQLVAVGAHVIGAVLNDPDASLSHKASVYHDDAVTLN